MSGPPLFSLVRWLLHGLRLVGTGQGHAEDGKLPRARQHGTKEPLNLHEEYYEMMIKRPLPGVPISIWMELNLHMVGHSRKQVHH